MRRILLDESVPRPLLRSFADAEAVTIDQLGWKGMRNGELLRQAEAHRFDVLITSDKNMRHQNSLAGYRLAVLVLPHTNWPLLRLMQQSIAVAATSAQPAQFTELPAA